MTTMPKILCINPRGAGDLHELRARRLTEGLQAEVVFYNIDRAQSYPAAMRSLWRRINSDQWDLIYQEGTGIAAGLNVIGASLVRKQKFIVSSGDPIGGFFHVTRGPLAGFLFGLYERLLYRASSGFVGWTPYLTGAALTMGAKRGATVEGAVALDTFVPYPPSDRVRLKNQFGLDPSHLVCGVVGSLRWTPRQSYCYGLELVETLKQLRRPDVSVLIVGDGTGRSYLEKRIPGALRSRVVFTGRLSEADVVGAINAMDIGFITQTLDGLGNFRLTTKLPEYLACGVPVAMSPVPGFYDYASLAGWPLPPFHPAAREFHERCAAWLERLGPKEIAEKASSARTVACQSFDYEILRSRFQEFVMSLLNDNSRPASGRGRGE